MSESKHEISYDEVVIIFDFMNEMLVKNEGENLTDDEKLLVKRLYDESSENTKKLLGFSCKKLLKQIENI